MKRKRLNGIIITVAIILLIPLVAMQFTEEVNWNLFDFMVMGALLLGTGLIGDFLIRKVKKIEYRVLLLIGLVASFLLIWAELAVGIFGTPLAGS
jgi:hypothetical protein